MFFSSKKNILGVDIGSVNIKIAEISFSNPNSPELVTFGFVNSPYQITTKKDSGQNIAKLAELIKNLCQKAGTTTKQCVISMPNSSVFSSVIDMPKMEEKELNSAVEFEAKKYVPLVLSDVDISWSVMGGEQKENSQKILLTAVPKQITQYYEEVFTVAGLEPKGEIEALALIRSLIGTSKINCVIIDIGGKSTGLNIIEKGFLRLSRNINIGGETITKKIAETLNISLPRAEQFKQDFGVSEGTFLPETIKPVLDLIKTEVRQILNLFQSNNNSIEQIILVGGGANLPGIDKFFSDLNIPIVMGNPLKAVFYKQELTPILKRYALSLPIAIGLALRQD